MHFVIRTDMILFIYFKKVLPPWEIEEGRLQKLKDFSFQIAIDRMGTFLSANGFLHKTFIANGCSYKVLPGIKSLVANIS